MKSWMIAISVACLVISSAPAAPVIVGTEYESAPPMPDDADPLNGRLATRILGGFHPFVFDAADQEAAFTDGETLGALTGLLRDFPGSGVPAWSGYWDIRIDSAPVFLNQLDVYSGNLDRDGRVFHSVDVYVTNDATPSAGGNWELVVAEVIPVLYGSGNPNPPGRVVAYKSTVVDSDGDLASNVTGLRLDMFAVSNTAGAFYDRWDADDPSDKDGQNAAIQSPLMFEIDAYFSTTPAPGGCENDIDGDQVCDAQEVSNVLITGNPDASNRILPDSDGDGLRDGEEDANRNGAPDAGETLTRNADSDGDGYEDGLEVLFLGADPLDANDPGTPIVDADGDGLPASIDPNDNNRDTDGDRYDDLYDALVFRDLAAASDASRVPNLGDVNGDAEAGNLDSLVIQALFLNSIDHTNPVFQAAGPGYDGFRYANPSRNGQAGNLDSLLIQAHFLGNLQTFPLRF